MPAEGLERRQQHAQAHGPPDCRYPAPLPFPGSAWGPGRAPSAVGAGGLAASVVTGLFSGPPYGVAERVFDEHDIRVCEPA